MGCYEKRIFPMLMDKQMNKESYQREREIALRNVSGRILEIGFGTGLNLPYYPEGIKKIVALDINPAMDKRARDRINASSIDVDYHCLNSEKLPFETGTFDTVVSTWTLCSIADLGSALLEIHRVLSTTGKFVFLEHGLAQEAMTQKLQKLITPVQKVLGCGCHLDREIDRLIKEAGFRIDGLEKFRMSGATTPLASSLFRGIAYPV